MAISPKRIIGPIFFEDNLNSYRFGIIFNEFTNQLTSYERKHCWFHQDSATSKSSIARILANNDKYVDDTTVKSVRIVLIVEKNDDILPDVEITGVRLYCIRGFLKVPNQTDWN